MAAGLMTLVSAVATLGIAKLSAMDAGATVRAEESDRRWSPPTEPWTVAGGDTWVGGLRIGDDQASLLVAAYLLRRPGP